LLVGILDPQRASTSLFQLKNQTMEHGGADVRKATLELSGWLGEAVNIGNNKLSV
jgi:hypothetical protein